jgi:hypothetical protein
VDEDKDGRRSQRRHRVCGVNGAGGSIQASFQPLAATVSGVVWRAGASGRSARRACSGARGACEAHGIAAAGPSGRDSGSWGGRHRAGWLSIPGRLPLFRPGLPSGRAGGAPFPPPRNTIAFAGSCPGRSFCTCASRRDPRRAAARRTSRPTAGCRTLRCVDVGRGGVAVGPCGCRSRAAIRPRAPLLLSAAPRPGSVERLAGRRRSSSLLACGNDAGVI